MAFSAEEDNQLTGAYIRMCPEDESFDHRFIMTRAYPICCTISNFFLFLTFCVYLLLPELRRPLFGKIIMAFIFSLFLAYLALSVISLGDLALIKPGNEDNGRDYNAICKILGFITVFCFLHAFFWMNVLSYDIYRKFTNFRNPSKQLRRHVRDSERIRLMKYALYAVGIPSLVTFITFIVEFLPDW